MIKDDLEAGTIKPLEQFKAKVNNQGKLNVYVPVDNTTKESLIDLFERNLSAIGWEKDFYLKKGGSFDKLTDGKIDKTEDGFFLYHRSYIYIK